MDLKDKVCVVTGGSSGLGQATVRHLIALGARVANVDLNDPRDGVPPDSLFFKTDVTDAPAVDDAMRAIVARLGGIHACVNCAGYVKSMPLVGPEGLYPVELFRRTVDVNLTGTFIVLSKAVEHMMRNAPLPPDGERGVIINTASIAGLDSTSSLAYGASKGALVAMTLTLARELAPHGIRANTIAPGYMNTPIFAGLSEEFTRPLLDKLVFPKRLGAPAEFARLVAHIIENVFFNASVVRFDAASRP